VDFPALLAVAGLAGAALAIIDSATGVTVVLRANAAAVHVTAHLTEDLMANGALLAERTLASLALGRSTLAADRDWAAVLAERTLATVAEANDGEALLAENSAALLATTVRALPLGAGPPALAVARAADELGVDRPLQVLSGWE